MSGLPKPINPLSETVESVIHLLVLRSMDLYAGTEIWPTAFKCLNSWNDGTITFQFL